MEKCARSQDAFLKVEFLGTPILLQNKTINEWHQQVFIMTPLARYKHRLCSKPPGLGLGLG